MTLVEKYKAARIDHADCTSGNIEDHAEVIVFGLINNLRGRAGEFDDMFANIDDDVKEELLQTNVDAVKVRLLNAMQVLR